MVRALTHVMWRDELEVFMLAQGHASLFDLFRTLDYTGHPGLRPALVWLITKATSDPFWMQVAHTVLAVAASAIVSSMGRSFSRLKDPAACELFPVLRVFRHQPQLRAAGADRLCLRRNPPASSRLDIWRHGCCSACLPTRICSAPSGRSRSARSWRSSRCGVRPALLAGGVGYLAMLALAVAAMAPAPDFGPWGRDFAFDLSRVGSRLAVCGGAVCAAQCRCGAIGDSHFWWIRTVRRRRSSGMSNAVSDVVALSQANVEHPLRLVLVLAAPVAMCWLIARSPLAVLQFVLAYVGIVAFATIWDFAGDARSPRQSCFLRSSRQSGLRVRSVRRPSCRRRCSSRCLRSTPLRGLLTLAFRRATVLQIPQCRRRWIRQNDLADAFLIGSRDAQVSSVSGYLGRSIYYLECECRGTFVVWNDKRSSMLSDAEFWRRLAAAAEGRQGRPMRS